MLHLPKPDSCSPCASYQPGHNAFYAKTFHYLKHGKFELAEIQQVDDFEVLLFSERQALTLFNHDPARLMEKLALSPGPVHYCAEAQLLRVPADERSAHWFNFTKEPL